MKKIIASLSGLTLSLTPTVGFINSNYSDNISYLQKEENDTTVEKKDEEKPIIKEDSLSQADLQTLNEVLKIVKEKQEIKDNKDNKEKSEDSSIMSKIGAFAVSAKDVL